MDSVSTLCFSSKRDTLRPSCLHHCEGRNARVTSQGEGGRGGGRGGEEGGGRGGGWVGGMPQNAITLVARSGKQGPLPVGNLQPVQYIPASLHWPYNLRIDAQGPCFCNLHVGLAAFWLDSQPSAHGIVCILRRARNSPQRGIRICRVLRADRAQSMQPYVAPGLLSNKEGGLGI